MYPRAQSTYLAALGVLASVTWLTVHAPLQGRALNALMPSLGMRGLGFSGLPAVSMIPYKGRESL